MQDGGTVDPVSGNEVPVGSLQEEVRDDISAKLSEGEFVIPADVVRYIGLEKLMKMRDAAKEGLARMEEVGQMGNADTAPAADEDFDDGFDTEIDDIIGEVDGELQMARGGFVSGEDLSKAPKNTAVDVRYYKHPDGRMMFVTFINNRPMTSIPEGFTQTDKPVEQKVGKAAEERDAAVGVAGGGDGGGGGGDTPFGGEGGVGAPVATDRDDPLSLAMGRASTANIVSKVASAIPLAMGPLGMLAGPSIRKAGKQYAESARSDAVNTVATQLSPFGVGELGDFESVKSMTSQFGNNTGVMNGYFLAATDPFTSGVFNDLVSASGASNLTPAQVGVMGLAIDNAVKDKVANGMSLADAQQITRDEFDISGTSVSGGSVGESWQNTPADMNTGAGNLGSTAATADSPDGPDGANAPSGGGGNDSGGGQAAEAAAASEATGGTGTGYGGDGSEFAKGGLVKRRKKKK